MEDICLACKSDEVCQFYVDWPTCTTYYVCRKCGKVWREIAGIVPAEDFMFDEVEMLSLLPSDVFDALTETAVNTSMLDLVHRCIKCQTIAFEVEVGMYKCSDSECGFEWEVYQSE